MDAARGPSPVADQYILDWLARAADNHATARHEWATQDVALLRCGNTFAAIRIPGALVHAALDTDDPAAVREALVFDLGGPVIHDGHATSPYYALIQWHAGLVWDGGEDTPCLGRESYLGVPSLTRREPPGPHWAVAPRYDGDLCRPSTVRKLINRARKQLASAETGQ